MEKVIRELVNNIGESVFRKKYIDKSFYFYLGEYGNEWLSIENFDNILTKSNFERIFKRNSQCYFIDKDDFYRFRGIFKKDRLICNFGDFNVNIILILRYNIEKNMFKYGLFIEIVKGYKNGNV